MFKRPQFKELALRISEERNKLQALVGPRQVGKSTLVRQVLQETEVPNMMVSSDGIPKDNTAWIGEVWDTARARMRLGGYREYLLVIDEVHKIDNWSEEVKKQWDADTFNDVNLKVVILGSSRLLLKDGLTESLAGRYELIRMPHWSLQEMHGAFGLELSQYIYFGGYPGAAKFIGDESRWRRYIKDSIVSPAIDQDVLMTRTVYKPELMRQLFELGCTYSGEEMSLTKLLGQLQDAGNVTTLANYLTTLSEAQMLAGLHKYASDNARKYNSVPKLMVYNTALLSALAGMSFEKVYTSPALWGRWVESAVGAHILNAAKELDYKVYYWRERDDEVDFVIDSRRRCVAVEVKSGSRTAGRSLQKFAAAFHPLHSLVVGTGGVPLEEFLSWDLSTLFE